MITLQEYELTQLERVNFFLTAVIEILNNQL